MFNCVRLFQYTKFSNSNELQKHLFFYLPFRTQFDKTTVTQMVRCNYRKKMYLQNQLPVKKYTCIDIEKCIELAIAASICHFKGCLK